MPRTSRPAPPSSPTFMDPALMPWVLVSEVYWVSWKLLERRLYHLGISASQARLLAVLLLLGRADQAERRRDAPVPGDAEHHRHPASHRGTRLGATDAGSG